MDDLADQPSPEAHGHGMCARSRLKLREQVPDMRFDCFLREEQPLADLSVDEPVGDELQHLDLPHSRLLLELAERALQRDHVGTAGASPPRSDLLEPARVGQITAEDLLALGGVHGPSIGAAFEPL